MATLTEEEIVSICEMELSDIDSESDLSSQRSRNMDYYMGDMDEYLPSGEDRSDVVTRDALDTVESVLPSLLKIYVEADNAITFNAHAPGDEDQAKKETNAVRHCFYEKNPGFLTLYSYIKDALISKNSVGKSWWVDGKQVREEYQNLNEIEAQKLLLDTEDYELKEYEESEDGINIVLLRQEPGRVHVEVIPPEEFFISRNATSVDPKEATFCAHRVNKTVSELIEMGFDRDKVEDIPFDDNLTEERLARRNLSDEQTYDTVSTHKSMREVWVTECYVNIDRDDDGIAELLKVTLAGTGSDYNSGNKLLEVDEVDCNPFVSFTPVILTHKFYGFSLVDLVQDIQKIRTKLFREILDNTYLANNLRMGANEKVNLDDLLVARPGGIVRTEGVDPPGNHISPIINPPLPQEAFGLLEVLDTMLKNRTGVGDEVAGLDSASLANINTGVIAQAYDMARMRIELMARILGEVGLKPMFLDIHRLLHKNQHQSVKWEINGQWVDIEPAHWRPEREAKVNVGLGHNSREKKLLATTDILQLQEKAASSDLFYLPPEEYRYFHNTLSDRIESHGLDINQYFPPPDAYQPKQPPPNPEIEFRKQELQIEQAKLMLKKEENQTESQVKLMLAQSREREMAVRTQMEQIKGQFQLEKIRTDEQNQIMRAQTDKARMELEAMIQVRQQEWKEQKEAQDQMLERQAQQIDLMKANLESATDIEVKVMDVNQKKEAEILSYMSDMFKMFQQAENDRRDRQEAVSDWVSKNGSENAKSFVGSLPESNVIRLPKVEEMLERDRVKAEDDARAKAEEDRLRREEEAVSARWENIQASVSEKQDSMEKSLNSIADFIQKSEIDRKQRQDKILSFLNSSGSDRVKGLVKAL